MAMLLQPLPDVHPNAMMWNGGPVLWQNRKLGEYSSGQKILLVGEGDFSFSSALANAFGTAANVTATSLDSLELCGIFLMLASSDGGRVTTWSSSCIGLFWEHFSRMCRSYSLSMVRCMSHQSREPYLSWRLEDLAQLTGLQLKESVPFRVSDYPGYCTRRGVGKFASHSFNLRNTETYKFVSRSFSLPAKIFSSEKAVVQLQGMPFPHANSAFAHHYSAPGLLSIAGSHATANQETFLRTTVVDHDPNLDNDHGSGEPFFIQRGPPFNSSSSFNPDSVREGRLAPKPLECNIFCCRFPSIGEKKVVAGDLESPDMSKVNLQAGETGGWQHPQKEGSERAWAFTATSLRCKLDQTVGRASDHFWLQPSRASKSFCKTGTASGEANALENVTICNAPQLESTKCKKTKKKESILKAPDVVELASKSDAHLVC